MGLKALFGESLGFTSTIGAGFLLVAMMVLLRR